MSDWPSIRWSVLVLGVVLVSCDKSTKPVSVATVLISPPTLSLVQGTSQGLTATVADSKGNTLSNRKIVWSIDKPATASVSETGVVTGIAVGTATVTATSEGKFAAIPLTVVPVPVASVRVIGPTTPLTVGTTTPLLAEVRDARSNVVTDRVVTWASSNPQIASINTTGLVSALGVGTATITATSEGQSGTLGVTVQATGAAPVIQSITPATLIPGESATLTGTGFFTNDSLAVSIAGVRAPLLGGGGNQVVVLVPCVKGGTVTVDVVVGAQKASASQPLQTTTLSLGVGQTYIASSARASRCSELITTGVQARYGIAVFNLSTAASALSDFTMQGNPPVAGAAAKIVPSVETRPALRLGRDEEYQRDSVHFAVLERDRRLYETHRARSRAPSVLSRSALARALPTVGDMRSAFFTFSTGCADASNVLRAKAIYVGTRSIIWEDSANTLQSANIPELSNYYRRLGVVFDQDQYASVQKHFGDPLRRDPLTDGDGRIHMIFTQKVNGTGAAAFVTSCDQLSPAEAAGSNFGEYFYGYVPTASGLNLGNSSTVDGWFNFMGRTVVHEVKHIASISARFANNAQTLEESWLEEGTARHAEEVWVREYLHKVAWKANTGFGTVNTNGLYCDFHPAETPCLTVDTLRRPGYGMRRHFNELREKLVEPWNWSPYGQASGQTGSIFYQTTWSLVRYTIDRYAASDVAFLNTLTSARTSGTTNLTATAGVTLDRLIGGWGLALLADDYPGVPSFDADAQFPTWNLRNIYAGLNQSPTWSTRWPTPYPIVPVAIPFGAFATTRTGLRGGGHAFYELSGSPAASQLLGLSGLSGGVAAPELRVAVVRLQ